MQIIRIKNTSYHIFVETHEPVYHIIKRMQSLRFIVILLGRVSKVHSRYSLMLPALAKGILII